MSREKCSREQQHSAAEEQSLAGVFFLNGRLVQKIRHASGKEEIIPVPELDRDPFSETQTVPQDWKPSNESPITERRDREYRTSREHVDRSCLLEALLIKIFSARIKDQTDTFDTRGNSALAEVLRDLCRIAGSPWDQMVSRIK
jgi:hypothetical protein